MSFLCNRYRNPAGAWALRAVVALAALVAAGCSDDNTLTPGELRDAGMVDSGQLDANRSFPDTGIGEGALRIDRLAPNHGPFTGGTTTVIRGAGFAATAEVRVDGRQVQPADITLIDDRRLQIVVPAGEVGPADVSVVVEDEEALLPAGFVYDAFFVAPNRGAVSGGTIVEIQGSGTAFEEGDTVRFGREACLDPVVVSETRITCRTPPSVSGSVDVVVERGDGTEIVAEDAFTYYDSSDPVFGGLGGGPLAGTLNVTVIDASNGNPLEGAVVVLDEDTAGAKLTDIRGQTFFSPEGLEAPVTLHVSKPTQTVPFECEGETYELILDQYVNASFVSFDAQDVTVFLEPGAGGGFVPPPPPPSCFPQDPGRGRFGSVISGELIWEGPNEFGPNPWTNIPDPRGNEEKVAYVLVSDNSPTAPLIWPGIGANGGHRVLEVIPMDGQDRLGYPYQVFARPAGLAVFALAGLENRETQEFIPYVMGVARNVLAGPGESVQGVDMIMNIPLDDRLDVDVTNLPERARLGPDEVQSQALIDLGGEGVLRRSIVRPETLGCLLDEQCPARHTCEPANIGTGRLETVCVQSFDIARGRPTEGIFRMFSQPSSVGALRDARYEIQSSWVTAPFDNPPLTQLIRSRVSNGPAAVPMDDFLGIPSATQPSFGERLPVDRILRWEADTEGRTPPTFHLVQLFNSADAMVWELVVPGDVYEAPIPDLSTLEGMRDLGTGPVDWTVVAVRVPGLDFNEFTYRFMSPARWEAYALDVFTFQR